MRVGTIGRIGAFFIACFLSVQVGAATTYEFDWEVASPSAANVRNSTDGYWYHGNCFAKSAGDLFNSIELSTKYARIGSKSIRKARQSLLSNSQGHNNCESFLKSETIKHRNEIRYGYGKGVGTFENWVMGAERWFRMSVYIPSDEGNFSTWNASTKRIMLAQWIGTEGADHSHEVSLLLTGGPKIVMDGYYGTRATAGATEYGQTFGEFNLKKDAWNDIIVRHRRSWQTAAENPTGHGIVQVWANCADWANCTPVVDYAGRAAIRNKSKGWFKHGLYADISTWDHQHVIYSDAIKIGIRDTETEEQMLALMAADYTGGGTGPDDPETPIASDLNVNAGAAITSLQDPINFTVSGMNDITGCKINSGAVLPVKWDYTGAASGKFKGVDTTGFAAAGTVRCYDEPYTYNPTMSDANFTSATGVVDTSNTSLDHWGYAAGRRLTKAASGSGDAYWTYGSAYNFVANDRVRVDITYSCTGASCSNMYFDLGYNVQTAPYGDWRIRAAGTAGALAITNITQLYGTDRAITNETLPDDTYRASIYFRADGANNFRNRAGWTSGSAANLTLDLLEWTMRKNWTTRVIEDAVTFDVPDATAPILSGCTLTNELSGVIETDGTPGYKATISCTADEIGGNDYAMIATTDTSPDAADVQAGTGAIWSASKSADTSEIVFEAIGMEFQDLWASIVRCDLATPSNCSDVATATFDDGVGIGEVKKLKFAYPDTDIWCYHDADDPDPELRNRFIQYTGDMAIQIYSGNPRVLGDTPFPDKLAYDSAVAFVNGSSTTGMIEENLEAGSINALSTGDQGYYVIYTDGYECHGQAPIQIIAE